jgi:hypothetical protein
LASVKAAAKPSPSWCSDSIMSPTPPPAAATGAG